MAVWWDPARATIGTPEVEAARVATSHHIRRNTVPAKCSSGRSTAFPATTPTTGGRGATLSWATLSWAVKAEPNLVNGYQAGKSTHCGDYY